MEAGGRIERCVLSAIFMGEPPSIAVEQTRSLLYLSVSLKRASSTPLQHWEVPIV